MKAINTNDERIIIKKANKFDAKALIKYLNIIDKESDFLTFGEGQFSVSVLKKYWVI